MNTRNLKFFKRVQIFFKAAHIFIIVLLVLYIISVAGSFFLPSEKGKIGAIPFFFHINAPDFNLTIENESLQAKAIFGQAAVIFENSPLILLIFTFLLGFIEIAAFYMLIRIIRQIIRSISENNVFSLLNSERLKYMGYILLIYYILEISYQIGMGAYISSAWESGSISPVSPFVLDYRLGYIVSIIFVFFISAVFRIGADISDENKSFV